MLDEQKVKRLKLLNQLILQKLQKDDKVSIYMLCK
nr:MAG TPA: hypothetical protein [Bacteriophage sp.]